MKKILYTILFLVMILLPSNVMAADLDFKFSVSASDNGIVSASGQKSKFTIYISSTNGDAINSCSFSIVSPQSGAQFSDIRGANDWQWQVDDSNGSYTISSATGLTDTEDKVIAYVEYVVTGASSVTFSNISCSTGDSEGTTDDISINMSVADLIVKVDGVPADGEIIPNKIPADKNSVLLSVTSSSQLIQDNIKIYAKDTASGDVLICEADQADKCTVNFTANYYCTSDDCIALKIGQATGDNIKLSIESSGMEPRTLFLLKEVTQAVYDDSSISKLTVFGVDVPLEKGKTEYTDIVVPYNTSSISVSATLSDPEHYTWDEEDNPNKYNYLPNTEEFLVILLVRPKDPNVLGANSSAYTVRVKFEGDVPVYSSSAESSDVPIIVSSSSSHSSPNPPTGTTSEIIIALILVGSLIYSIIMYKKNMSSYE